MVGDRRNRLLNGLTASGVFVFGAAVLWVLALISSWSSNCPHRRLELTGLDKGISAWPPGAQCIDRAHDLYYYEAQPWVKPVIFALLVSATVVLVASVVAAVRDRRAVAAANHAPGAARRAAP